MCGVRMRTSGFVDYKSARLLAGSGPVPFPGIDEVLPAGKLTLDNGYVQFAVAPGHGMAADDAGEYAAVYIVPQGRRGYSASRVYADDRWPEPLVRIRRTAGQELTLSLFTKW